MSAFIVSDKTLQNVVRFLTLDLNSSGNKICYGLINRLLLKGGFNLEYAEHRDRLIKEMALLNRAGVNERYDEKETEKHVCFINGRLPTMIQAYKSLGCFLYQCCEGDIPGKSDLYRMFDEIKNELAHTIVHNLSEYNEAKWDE